MKFEAVWWLSLISLVVASAACQSGRRPVERVRLGSIEEIREVIEQSTREIVPLQPRSLNLFDRYSPKGDALWARGWTWKLDMTGVSTDKARTCTLISPRHVLMAKHYQREYEDVVLFHDRRGRAIVRFIEEKLALPGGSAFQPGGSSSDMAVGRLDEEVPVKFYRVLPPRPDYAEHLIGALAVITDKDRNLLMRRVTGFGEGHVRFGKADEYPPKCADPLNGGDSGNPGFLVVGGEPVLIETHTYAQMGQGPFISYPENYAGINRLMAELGGGYQLTPIEIGP